MFKLLTFKGILLSLFSMSISAITVTADTKDSYPINISGQLFDLQRFQADEKMIKEYSQEHNIKFGLKRDFEKAPKCSRAEIHALRGWTNNSVHRTVNPVLRGLKEGKFKGKDISKRLKNLILMIASGVNCAPQFHGTVLRIEDTPDDVLLTYNPGNEVVVLGFTGTSKEKEPPESMLSEVKVRQTLIIHNARGADIDSLGISYWKNEREVLLSPGTRLKVISAEENDQIKKPKDKTKKQYNFVFDQLD